eukprot:TRINITY_DN7106_c0_g1_i1.p2 TRINITY_DN7106_c0_g1~~TRINITY_DN7106_c0_g1_i1.p2  ORF type:complete len:121 (-),score=12.54 TRINITY_DN7106_c0_g1_i1:43-405(-)
MAVRVSLHDAWSSNPTGSRLLTGVRPRGFSPSVHVSRPFAGTACSPQGHVASARAAAPSASRPPRPRARQASEAAEPGDALPRVFVGFDQDPSKPLLGSGSFAKVEPVPVERSVASSTSG